MFKVHDEATDAVDLTFLDVIHVITYGPLNLVWHRIFDDDPLCLHLIYDCFSELFNDTELLVSQTACFRHEGRLFAGEG